MSKLPPWICQRISPTDVDAINKAVADAEATTSGEIVVVVARRSSAIGHVPILAATSLMLLFFVLGIDDWQRDEFHSHFMTIVGEVIGLGLLGACLGKLECVQRILIRDTDEIAQVGKRAEAEFFANQIGSTHHSTGVLIFISLMERRAVLLADKAINEKIPAGTWANLLEGVTQSLGRGEVGHGLATAVTQCGELLATHFPRRADDANELRDGILFKE